MSKEIKIIELKIDDIDGSLDRISLVSDPAIEENWMFFNKKNLQFKLDKTDKRLIVGPAMIPNQKIIRFDEDTEENYYVWFSEETIRKCAELYFKNADINDTNLEHTFAVDDLVLVESWFVEDPEMDKSKALGFENMPKGTWFCTYKINNDQVWHEFITTGMVKGFSIEGVFNFKKNHKKLDKLYNKIIEILKAIDE